MALKPLQADKPLGQFDALDALLVGTTIKGGEVLKFSYTTVPGSDKAAHDSFDGYAPPDRRTYLDKATSGTETGILGLADDGITGYGTLFGTVVGGTVGQQSTGGAVLGPHSAAGSGKLTLWTQPGLYAVSLDNTYADLQPSSATSVPGAVLGYSSGGLLSVGQGTRKVATFVEFATNGSLVSTPNNLVGTFNPPDGYLNATTRSFTWAVVYFAP